MTQKKPNWPYCLLYIYSMLILAACFKSEPNGPKESQIGHSVPLFRFFHVQTSYSWQNPFAAKVLDILLSS